MTPVATASSLAPFLASVVGDGHGDRGGDLAALLADSLWHCVLDPCPLTASRLGDGRDETVASFLEALLATPHRMDWTMHLELGRFLRTEDPDLWQELATAAMTRWLIPGDRDGSWIALGGSVLPGTFLLGKAPEDLAGAPTVAIGRCSKPFPRAFLYQTGRGPFSGLGTAWQEYVPQIERVRAEGVDGSRGVRS
jgi:hypothetical protein